MLHALAAVNLALLAMVIAYVVVADGIVDLTHWVAVA